MEKIEISIHALRGEGDLRANTSRPRTKYFNPRPPWGGRLQYSWNVDAVLDISIHALRGEGDLIGRCSTARSASISIHALRGEGDRVKTGDTNQIAYFNPRPPWGGRPVAVLLPPESETFQSTPSVGRATCSNNGNKRRKQISIHALRGEGDCKFFKF